MKTKKRTLKIVQVACNALEIQFNDGKTLCEFSSDSDDYISSGCQERAELVLSCIQNMVHLLKE